MINRHPMHIAISRGGAAPVLARRVRERGEAMRPSGYGRLAAFMHRQRARVKANEDISPRRIWERFIDGSGAEDALRGDAAEAEQKLAELLSAAALRGDAYLVVAGPGATYLLTS